MKVRIVKVQKWLPRYLSELLLSMSSAFAEKEFDSFGAMAKAVTSYIEGYRVNQTLRLGHCQKPAVDYSTRIRYSVGADRIIIHNITGRVNMLKITLDYVLTK